MSLRSRIHLRLRPRSLAGSMPPQSAQGILLANGDGVLLANGSGILLGGNPDWYFTGDNSVDLGSPMVATTDYEIDLVFLAASGVTGWIASAEPGSGDRVRMQLIAGGAMRYYHNSTLVVSGSGLDDGDVHRVQASWDGSNVSLSIDEEAAVTASDSTGVDTTTNITLGLAGLVGKISNVNITMDGVTTQY